MHRLIFVLGAALAALAPAAPAGADTIFGIARKGGAQQVFKVDRATGAPTQLTRGTRHAHSLTAGPGPGTATFGRQVGRRNIELFTVDARGRERRITHTRELFEVSGSWSPDGKQLVVINGPVRDGRIGGLAIYSRRGRLLRQLIASQRETGVVQARWSPDGRWIAFGTDAPDSGPTGWQLDVMRPDGSGRRTLLGPEENPATFAWHPDGARVVVGNYTTLRLVPVAGGNPTVVGGLEGREPSWPAFSPDGSRLLFQDAKRGMGRQVLNVATGAVRPLSRSVFSDAVWVR